MNFSHADTTAKRFTAFGIVVTGAACAPGLPEETEVLAGGNVYTINTPVQNDFSDLAGGRAHSIFHGDQNPIGELYQAVGEFCGVSEDQVVSAAKLLALENLHIDTIPPAPPINITLWAFDCPKETG